MVDALVEERSRKSEVAHQIAGSSGWLLHCPKCDGGAGANSC